MKNPALNAVAVLAVLALSSPVVARSPSDHVIYMDAGAASHTVFISAVFISAAAAPAAAAAVTALLTSAAAASVPTDDTAARRELAVRMRLTALGLVVD